MGVLQKLSKHEPLQAHAKQLASVVHDKTAISVPISALTVAISQAAIKVNERYSGGRDFVPAANRSTLRPELEVLERNRRLCVDSASRHPMNRDIFKIRRKIKRFELAQMQTKSLGNGRNVKWPRRKHKPLSLFCCLRDTDAKLAQT